MYRQLQKRDMHVNGKWLHLPCLLINVVGFDTGFVTRTST